MYGRSVVASWVRCALGGGNERGSFCWDLWSRGRGGCGGQTAAAECLLASIDPAHHWRHGAVTRRPPSPHGPPACDVELQMKICEDIAISEKVPTSAKIITYGQL